MIAHEDNLNLNLNIRCTASLEKMMSGIRDFHFMLWILQKQALWDILKV